MGCRAVMMRQQDADSRNPEAVGVYLHWDGDENTVRAMLAMCGERGYRSPDAEREPLGLAKLVGVACNLATSRGRDGYSVRIAVNPLAHYHPATLDNGIWLIRDWELVGNIDGNMEWGEGSDGFDPGIVAEYLDELRRCNPTEMA